MFRSLVQSPDSRSRQRQIGRRCPAALLDKGVNKHRSGLHDRKHHSRDSLVQAHPNLPQAIIELADHRHSNRPSELNQTNLSANGPAIRLCERIEPFAHGFHTRFQTKESYAQSRQRIGESVSFLSHIGKRFVDRPVRDSGRIRIFFAFSCMSFDAPARPVAFPLCPWTIGGYRRPA